MGGKDTCSFNVQVKCDSLEKYCNSRGRDSRHMWVDSVSISTLHHHSGNNGGYYKNITECPEIYSGTDLHCIFTPDMQVLSTMYWRWIDYNADGMIDNLMSWLLRIRQYDKWLKYYYFQNGLSPRLSRMESFDGIWAVIRQDHAAHSFMEKLKIIVSINGGTSFGGSTEENEMEIRTPQTLKCLGGCLDLRRNLNQKNDPGDVQTFWMLGCPNPSDHQVFVQISEAGVSQISFL